MADLKKFLDKQGVSTLWSKIAEKVAAEAEARDAAIATAVADIKYRVNTYSNLYRDIINNISLNDFKIDNFFTRANIKVVAPVVEKKVEIDIPVFHKELPTDVEDNLTLLV